MSRDPIWLSSSISLGSAMSSWSWFSCCTSLIYLMPIFFFNWIVLFEVDIFVIDLIHEILEWSVLNHIIRIYPLVCIWYFHMSWKNPYQFLHLHNLVSEISIFYVPWWWLLLVIPIVFRLFIVVYSFSGCYFLGHYCEIRALLSFLSFYLGAPSWVLRRHYHTSPFRTLNSRRLCPLLPILNTGSLLFWRTCSWISRLPLLGSWLCILSSTYRFWSLGSSIQFLL